MAVPIGAAVATASASAPPEPLHELRTVLRTFPVIDNHAHNLLLASELDNSPFETITTEARGWALEDAHTSLAHIRAAKQLAELYGLDPRTASWTDVLERRREWVEQRYDELVRRCLAGTHAVLLDDGLGGIAERCHGWQWHSQFTGAGCRQIVRIETLAEGIMEAALREATEEIVSEEFLAGAWVIFTSAFEDAIKDAVAEETVAGFKSVVCYRTGLDVEADYEKCLLKVGKSFERYAVRCIRKREFRMQSKAVNDYLVTKTMEVLSASAPAGGTSKPIQFHTGLGDSDIKLNKSDPSHLQPLIEHYPNVPVVLLHSSWPYTRQAAYLATMYKHVFLDLGEVFPMLSRDGQVGVVRQAFELAPYSKLLWSTDGHFFPETYWLANKQFREVLEIVLTDYVRSDQMSEAQAVEAAKNIYFDNSNRLYKLDYFVPGARRPSSLTQRPKGLQGAATAAGAGALVGAAAASALAIDEEPDEDVPDPDEAVPDPLEDAPDPDEAVPDPDDVAISRDAPKDPPVSVPRGNEQVTSSRAVTGPLTIEDRQSVITKNRVTLLRKFLQRYRVKHVYVQWLDYMGTTRCRMFPIAAFRQLVKQGTNFGISRGNVGTLQNDHLTSVVNTAGQIYIEPDLRSLRPALRDDPLGPAATVFSFWRSEDNGPLEADARGGLVKMLAELLETYNIHPMLGFEIEVTFLRRKTGETEDEILGLTSNHAWSTISAEDYSIALPLIAEIIDAFSSVGIELSSFHSESGPGQYELVLPPLAPLAAIDTLYTARSVIARVAARHNIRATLHPCPFPGGTGNASHAHISLNKAPVVPEPKYERLFGTPQADSDAFWAGVLSHLEAICAFSLPEKESYERVRENAWCGGTWVAWGTQNRECPLRKAGTVRWEVRCLDGFANMYLAIGSVLAAGLIGLKRKLTLPKDCECKSHPHANNLAALKCRGHSQPRTHDRPAARRVRHPATYAEEHRGGGCSFRGGRSAEAETGDESSQ